MAGFSRAPSAWPFEFNGLNTKDAPDQLNPAQHPIATNIRAIGNRFVQTRPGYELFFVAESSPVITTTCPIDTALEGEAYEFTFEVTGGVAPFTWTIISGALPSGLTLDSSTGVVSGTPTDYGVFSFTVQVTDAIGHTDTVSCSVLALPLSACGTFPQLRWAHNSRVGAFLGATAGTIYFIGMASSVATHLDVWRSTQFGKKDTWELVLSTPDLDDNIISFDCHESGTDVGIGIQETYGSGRLSFSIFSKSSNTLTLSNQEIVASLNIVAGDANDNGGCVSVTKRANGNWVVMYDTDIEVVSAANRFRYGVRESSDAGVTWSAELQSGQAGNAVDYVCGRVVAYSNNELRLVSGNSDSPFFGRFMIQTVDTSNTFGGIVEYFTGGALSQVQQGRCVGDYAVWDESGTPKMLLPQRTLEVLRYAIFAASTTPDYNNALSDTCFIASGTALCPQGSARLVGTNMHLMANSFDNSVPTFSYHKQSASPFNSYSPGTVNADQAGPIYSVLGEGIPKQEHSGIVTSWSGVEYYIGLRDSDGANLGMVFNCIRLDQLPTSASETISVWSVDCESASE